MSCSAGPELAQLASEIISCRTCSRLSAFLEECRRNSSGHWARPVPGFGDPMASLYILGLAPGYNGANRHGRVFTGDESGRWLWSALHAAGVCSAPDSTAGDSPLTLEGVYVGNAVRCCPPGNRPTAAELAACRTHLERELAALPRVTVVLALGRLAHESYLRLLDARLSLHPFRHGAVHHPATHTLVDSYHPSRQNTNTGLLTRVMWADTIRRACEAAGLPRVRKAPGG